MQRKEISGPPRYWTTDWPSARESVKRLHALNPSRAITGHGVPFSGEELSKGLERLVRKFDPAGSRPVRGRQEALTVANREG